MRKLARKSPAALLDLRQQVDYLGDRSLETAERFLASAEAAFELLAVNPELGSLHLTPHGRLSGLRSWTIGDFPNHVIFYQAVDDGVVVIRVVHGARDADALSMDV